MSHLSRLPSAVSTKAPFFVPTSTRTPLIAISSSPTTSGFVGEYYANRGVEFTPGSPRDGDGLSEMVRLADLVEQESGDVGAGDAHRP